MARDIGIGDEVAVIATVRRRVTEDRVSVSIPSYYFPHSIRDSTSKVKRGQKIDLTAEVTRMDDEGGKVTIGPRGHGRHRTVNLVAKCRAAKRKVSLRDKAD